MFRLLKKLKFIFICILLILGVATITSFGNFSFNKKSEDSPTSTEVNNNSTDKSNSNEESSSTEKSSSSDNTTNILLLGDNTDSMMIASIDDENKDIKIIPVENASYIDNSSKENLLKSIEKMKNINLDKFVQVGISDLMNLVSILDGITVDVKEEDLQLINNLIPKDYAESTDENKGKMTLLSESGTQKVNEYQAMAYASVIANDKEKQKEVLLSLIDNVKKIDFTKYIEVFNTMKPYVDTNLTIPDMLKLASSEYTFE